MNHGLRRTVHLDVTIVFNWKTMTVIACAYVIRLLLR